MVTDLVGGGPPVTMSYGELRRYPVVQLAGTSTSWYWLTGLLLQLGPVSSGGTLPGPPPPHTATCCSNNAGLQQAEPYIFYIFI